MRISDWSSDVCSSDLFYDYDDKRKPTPSPVVAEIIDDFRNRAGLKRRDISDDEIVARTLYTMVNEGAKILEEDIAQRASDIDVVWLYGRSEEHTSEIQSLMRISYAVFCLKKKTNNT